MLAGRSRRGAAVESRNCAPTAVAAAAAAAAAVPAWCSNNTVVGQPWPTLSVYRALYHVSGGFKSERGAGVRRLTALGAGGGAWNPAAERLSAERVEAERQAVAAAFAAAATSGVGGNWIEKLGPPRYQCRNDQQGHDHCDEMERRQQAEEHHAEVSAWREKVHIATGGGGWNEKPASPLDVEMHWHDKQRRDHYEGIDRLVASPAGTLVGGDDCDPGGGGLQRWW